MNLGRFGCFLLTLVVTDSDCFSFPDSGGLFSTDSYTVCLTAKSRTGSADTEGGSGYLVSRACLYGFPFVSGNQNGTRRHALFATIAVPYVPHPPTFREEPFCFLIDKTQSNGLSWTVSIEHKRRWQISGF